MTERGLDVIRSMTMEQAQRLGPIFRERSREARNAAMDVLEVEDLKLLAALCEAELKGRRAAP